MRFLVHFPTFLLLTLVTFSRGNSINKITETCERTDVDRKCKNDNPLLKNGKYFHETKSPRLPNCAKPVDQLGEGCTVPGLVERHSFVPPWFNETMYKEGQEFARKNRFLISFCNYIGAVLVACGDQAGEVILGTGKSHVRERAIRRYLGTDKQVWLWYENDLTDEDGLVSTSLKNMRAIHKSVDVGYQNVSREQKTSWIKENLNWTLNEIMWNAILMDLRNSTIPEKHRSYDKLKLKNCKNSKITMNQFSMMIAQYLFVAIPFIAMDIFEVMAPTTEQMIGWNHLWAVLGYAVGIIDDYNVALQPNLEATREYYKEFFRKIILPGLFSLQTESKILVEMLLNIVDTTTPDGSNSTPSLTMAVILQDVVGIPTPNLESILTRTEILRLYGWKAFKGIMRYSPQFVVDRVNSDLKEMADNLGKIWFGQVYNSDYLIAKYVWY